jgi:GntR family transcriptional repressor for pyruvate dehydrogenase complex
MERKSITNSNPAAGSAAERVVDFVRALIDEGGLEPGDRLPTERDLSLRLGVSRPSVRCGLSTLSAMGIVESRHGRGTYVCDGPPRLDGQPLRLQARLHRLSRTQMLEARRALAVAAAGLAATRASRAQVDRLSAILDGMAGAEDDRDRFRACHSEFHDTLAKAAGNPVLTALLDMLPPHPPGPPALARLHDEALRKIVGSHRRVYLALRARDPIRSRAAMESLPEIDEPRGAGTGRSESWSSRPPRLEARNGRWRPRPAAGSGVRRAPVNRWR